MVLPLFDTSSAPEPDRGLARATDPETSHDAAAQVNATELEDEVLVELKRGGQGTSVEIAARLGRSLVSVSPRLKPLEHKGLIARVGKKPNPSGRNAVVWAATQGG